MDQNTTNNTDVSKMTKEYAVQLKARSYYITIKSLQLYIRALRDTINTIDEYVSCTKDKKSSLKDLCCQCRVTGSILPDNKYRSCDKHISTLRSDIISLNAVCNNIDDFGVNKLIDLLCCIIETADNADESTELKNHALAITRKFMLSMLVTCTTLYYTKKTKHTYLGKYQQEESQ
jgi:hypothetical protein